MGRSSFSDVRALPATASIIVGAVGTAVFVGWLADIPLLYNPIGSFPTMKANAALSLVLAALALAWLPREPSLRGSALPLLCATLVVVIAAISLLEPVVGNLGLDELFARDGLSNPLDAPGRMSQATAVGLLLNGVALLAAALGGGLIFQAAAIGALLLSASALVADSFGFPELLRIGGLSAMAPQSAFCLLLLATGVVVARPDEGFGATLTSRKPGGVLVRRLGLPVIAFLLVLGACVEQLQAHGYLGQRVDSAVLVLTASVVVVLSLTSAARSLESTDTALRQSNTFLALRSRINQVIWQSDDRNSLAQAACEVAVEIGGLRRAAISVPGETGVDATIADVGAVGVATGGSAALDLPIGAPDQRFGNLHIESDPGQLTEAARVVLRQVAEDLAFAFEQSEGREARRTSELRFAGIFESAMDAVISVDEAQKILLFNPAAERMFGWSRDEVIGSPLDRLMPERFRAQHRDHVAHFSRTGVTSRAMGSLGRLYGLRRNGEEFLVEAAISQMQVRARPVFTVVLRDVTERELNLETVRRQASLLDLSHDAVIVWQWQGPISYWNHGAKVLYGYGAGEAVGHVKHKLLQSGPPERVAAMFEALERNGGWEGELEHTTRDGRRLIVEARSAMVADPGGRFVLETVRDVTARHSAEVALRDSLTQLQESQDRVAALNVELEHRVVERTAELEASNRELEAFSYSVSHDLRAPLRAIDGFSLAMLEDYGTVVPGEGRHYLETIRQSAQRMGALVDDLLAFSRLGRQALSKRQVVVREMVEECVSELRIGTTGRVIDVKVDSLPDCLADPALIRQVWVNLIGNAFKYTRQRNPAVIEIGATARNGHDVYFVRDNGTGFDMRYADKLFGVFQRLHRADEFEGTGVGLAIVQRVVRRHGGDIWVDARVGEGAVFFFSVEGGLHDAAVPGR